MSFSCSKHTASYFILHKTLNLSLDTEGPPQIRPCLFLCSCFRPLSPVLRTLPSTLDFPLGGREALISPLLIPLAGGFCSPAFAQLATLKSLLQCCLRKDFPDRPRESRALHPLSFSACELLQSTVTSSVHLFYSFTCLLLSLERKLHEDRGIVFFPFGAPAS